MLRIAHIVSGNDTGGAMTHIVTLSKALKEECELTLVVIRDGTIVREAERLGIPVKIIGSQGAKYLFKEVNQLGAYAKDHFDLIHTHGTRANLMGAYLYKRFKIKSVSTTHSDYRLEYPMTLRGMVLRTMNYWCYKNIPYHIGISQKMCQTLEERGVKASAIYPATNGIDTERYVAVHTKASFFAKYQIEASHYAHVIGIVARIHPVKGIDIFLKSAMEICKRRDDVLFVVAGGGDPELRAELQGMIDQSPYKERIHLLGRIEAIGEFYNAIDINTLTSLNETFPYVLMEGGYFGKPAIASNVGGVSELIEDQKTGLLFESGDVSALEKHMLTLLNNPEYGVALGSALKRAVLEKHTAKSMAQRHIAIYEAILSEK